MNWIQRGIGVVYFGLTLGLASGVVMSAVAPQLYYLPLVNLLRSNDVWVAAVAAVLFLLGGAYMVLGIRGRRDVQYIAFKSENGVIRITIRAVTDFIRRIADEFAAVISLAPAIEVARGAVTISIDARIKAGTNVPELCRLLQARVKEALQNDLGISDVREVRVNIEELAGPPSPTDSGV